MADMNSAFIKFGDSIKLSKAKRSELCLSRDAIRETVRSSFSDSDRSVKFCMQGSIAMSTTVNPIDEDDYDLDDGAYLCDYEDADEGEWPSTSAAHKWVKDAVEGQTSASPKDKNTCVRIPYKHGYHIDMPIYIMKDGTAHLAHKSQGWIKSDAKEFRNWFSDKCKLNDGQLRRVVRYLKRWKDCCGVELKGIELTILAASNFNEAKGRDDDSLRYTVEGIIESLDGSFECKKPVEPFEDLFEGFSQTKMDNVMKALRKLLSNLESAHETISEKEASDKLRASFGDSFPHVEDSAVSRYVKTAAPAVLKRDGRSG